MLPFPEVVWALVVGLLGHHVLLDVVAVFDFLEDRPRVEIKDADDHPALHPVEIQTPQVLLQRSDHPALLVLEDEPDVGRLRSIPLLDVFFEREDGALRVQSELRDAQ